MRIATVQVYLIIIKNDAFQVAIHEIEELVAACSRRVAGDWL